MKGTNISMNTKLQEFFKEADTRFEDAYKHLWSNYSMNSIQKSEIICDEMIFPILDQGLITCIEDLNESIKIVSSLLMSNGVNMSSKTIKMIKDKTYIKWKNRSPLNPYVMAKDGKIRINQMSFANYFSENHYKYTGLSWVHFNGAFYEEVSIHKIKAIIANNLEPTDVHESMITSIEKICEHECFTSISSFDSNEKTINTIDGFLNIDTAKIEHHTPERLSLRCIPFHYNPDVKKSDCPIFMGFLHTICSGDKEKIELILQMMGYTFTSHNKAKAFFLLEGVPDTGKSTLLEIIRKLVGENNAVNIPLDELNLQFMGSKLIGKLANICGELSSSKLPDTTKLKMITGSDAITIDRKYKEPIEVKISAKIILAANSIPENLISDAGVKARLVRIKFDNIIPKGKQDVCLIFRVSFWSCAKTKSVFKNFRQHINLIRTQIMSFINYKDSFFADSITLINTLRKKSIIGSNDHIETISI